jgi:hypothetical protein
MWNIIYNVSAKAGGWSGVAHDPIGLFIFLIVYVSITIAAMNKCFALINVLPQQVMRWISAPSEQIEGGESALKGAVEKGGAAVTGAAGTTIEAGKGSYEALKEAERLKAEEPKT